MQDVRAYRYTHTQSTKCTRSGAYKQGLMLKRPDTITEAPIRSSLYHKYNLQKIFQSSVNMKSAIAILGLSAVADAHGRWKCPRARDELTTEGKHDKFDNTANKVLNLMADTQYEIFYAHLLRIVCCLRPSVRKLGLRLRHHPESRLEYADLGGVHLPHGIPIPHCHFG